MLMEGLNKFRDSIAFYQEIICFTLQIILVNLTHKFQYLTRLKFTHNHNFSTKKILRGGVLVSSTITGSIKIRVDMVLIRVMDQLNQNSLNKEQLETKIIFRNLISKNLLNQNIQIFCQIKNWLSILRGMN